MVSWITFRMGTPRARTCRAYVTLGCQHQVGQHPCTRPPHSLQPADASDVSDFVLEKKGIRVRGTAAGPPAIDLSASRAASAPRRLRLMASVVLLIAAVVGVVLALSGVHA